MITDATSATAAGAPTICDSSAITHDVDGDLTVPEHTRCLLDDLAVHGTITVDRYATLDLDRVAVDGDVDLASRSTAGALLKTEIAGSVHLDHASNFGAGENSTIDGDVLGTIWIPSNRYEAGFSLDNAVTKGNVDVAAPLDNAFDYYYSLDDATIGGNLRLSGLESFSVGPVKVGGSLILNRLKGYAYTHQPAMVCAMDVAGNATVEDTSDAVNWGYVNCPSNDVVGGALLVHDNTGLVRLTGSVGGDLVCRRNLHHPRELRPGVLALAVQVGGRKIGQCQGLT